MRPQKIDKKWQNESDKSTEDDSKPAQGSWRIWSDAFDEDVLVVVFGQLEAEHVPAALDESYLAVTVLQKI